jgi:hypothetical protein
MKKALIIGIDDYPNSPLVGCVNDAHGVASVLKTNGDGSPNFDVRLVTVPTGKITRGELRQELTGLFSGTLDIALFYFAGHGSNTLATEEGYLVTPDHQEGDIGVSLGDLLKIVHSIAAKEIRSKIIILDSCHSGAIGQSTETRTTEISNVGDGVTMLTACRSNESAIEGMFGGVFTSLVVDALNGGASDLSGNITPGSVYAYVDQALGPWDQRPVFKTNVSRFTSLRSVSPKVPLETLRRLDKLFPEAEYEFPLDPKYEHTSEDGDPEKQRTFRDLQNCNRFGLIVPIGEQDMYWAAMRSTGCRLTALGYHYWRLARNGRI